jgi:hypothetical protein
MQEYFAGIDCPLANASLVNLKDISASDVDPIIPDAVASGSDAAGAAEDAQAERDKALKTNM